MLCGEVDGMSPNSTRINLQKCKRGFLVKVPHYVFIVFMFALFMLPAGCNAKPKEKPLSLGYFTDIYSPSISSDGNQILFTGCGHTEFPACTIYRFERDSNKLHRYLPRSSAETLGGGRYSPTSTRFVFKIIPLDSNKELIFDDSQIAIVNQDGNGLRVITQSKGVKLSPTLSYDEKSVVFYRGPISDKGSPLRKQKTRVIGSDLYKVDVRTGEETQLTRLEFYGVSDLYITPDGKDVVFAGDSPMRLPHTENNDAVKQFEDNYKKKYHGNTIIHYPLDGSEINKAPVPLFTFDYGSDIPTVAKDGTIWFKGRVSEEHYIHFYQRYPDSTLKELSYGALGEGKQDKALIVLHNMVVTPDGSQIVTLNANQNTGQRFIGVLDTKSNVHSNLTVPASAENITIR